MIVIVILITENNEKERRLHLHVRVWLFFATNATSSSFIEEGRYRGGTSAAASAAAATSMHEPSTPCPAAPVVRAHPASAEAIFLLCGPMFSTYPAPPNHDDH